MFQDQKLIRQRTIVIWWLPPTLTSQNTRSSHRKKGWSLPACPTYSYPQVVLAICVASILWYGGILSIKPGGKPLQGYKDIIVQYQACGAYLRKEGVFCGLILAPGLRKHPIFQLFPAAVRPRDDRSQSQPVLSLAMLSSMSFHRALLRWRPVSATFRQQRRIILRFTDGYSRPRAEGAFRLLSTPNLRCPYSLLGLGL